MAHTHAVVLFVFAASVALAVPVTKSLPSADSLVQTLAPVVQGADDVKRMQLLSSLRGTILPLSEVVMSRLSRVLQFEANELAPLMETAKTANHSIQVLEQKINEVHSQLAQLPKQAHALITQRDDALSQMDVANQTKIRVTTEGEEELQSLQSQIDQSRADILLLNKLLEWIDTTAPNWDDSESLIEMKKLVSGLSSQFLAQIGEPSADKSLDMTSPSAIQSHVEQLRYNARTLSEQRVAAYSALTTRIASEQTRLTSEFAEHEKAYNSAIAALSNVDHMQRVLTDTFSTHSLELKQAQENLARAQTGINDVTTKWGFEKQDLTNLKNTIETILVLLPHA